MSETAYANLGIEKEVYDKFREICQTKGFKIGKQVEILMREFNNKN